MFGRIIIDQLHSQWNHLKWYRIAGKHWFDVGKTEVHKGFSLKRLHRGLLRMPLFYGLLQYIPLLPIYVWIGNEGLFIGTSGIEGLVVAVLIVGFVTAIGPFRILGGAARYVYFALPFLYVILLQRDLFWAIVLMTVDCVLGISLAIFTLSRILPFKETHEIDEIRRGIKCLESNIEPKDTVIISPLRVAESIHYFSKNPKFFCPTFGTSPENLSIIISYFKYPELVEDVNKVDKLIKELKPRGLFLAKNEYMRHTSVLANRFREVWVSDGYAALVAK